LAETLAQAGHEPVVINADSVQVYRDIPILSAAPSVEEQSRFPHHLFGTWDGAIACSAADWAARARIEIDEAHERGALPILCGGTGLYMRTLLEGIAPVPPIDPQVRTQVRELTQDDARAALEIEDPQAAARLAPADAARTTRALEVLRSTGRRLADWQASKSGGIGGQITLHPIVLLPDRDWLYQRCDQRFAEMIENGAIEEVEALLARQLDPSLPVMRAIGVREIAAWLKGELGRDEAIAAGQIATRQYAKRQFTWFRHQPPVAWTRLDNKNVSDSSFFVSLLRQMG